MLLLYPLSASAVTYEWTDQNGTVNFTEDLGRVPKKYRKKAKKLNGEENGTPQITESSEPAKGKAKESAGRPTGTADKKTLSSKEETALRNDWLAAKARVQSLERSVTDLRGRLADTSKMSRNEYLSLQNTLKQEEFQLQEQTKRLDQARETAQKAGVNLD